MPEQKDIHGTAFIGPTGSGSPVLVVTPNGLVPGTISSGVVSTTK
jgi:hypothetical protein